MNLKQIARLFGLICVLASGLLACSIPSVPFISKAEPTATQRATTRSTRPTFTPRPKMTDTPVATATDQPTDVPPTTVPVTDTPKPTRKVVVQATKPKPTNAAPTATQPPQATKSPFTYQWLPWNCGGVNDPAICNVQGGVGCSHSGQHSIKVLVFANHNDPGSTLAGIKVRFSGSPGGPLMDPDEVTTDDGSAVKTLSSLFDDPKKNVGTFFAWLVNSSGNPISPFSPPIPINAKNENDAQTCWVGTIVFAGGY